jgi:hypothetical protein
MNAEAKPCKYCGKVAARQSDEDCPMNPVYHKVTDPLCGACRHPWSEHEDTHYNGIRPCGWTSLDYVPNQHGTHCTCYAFSLAGGEDPVFGGKIRRPALSEIGRQIDLLRAKIQKIGHDGLHTEACTKCAAVSRLNERLSYLGGL